MPLDPFLAAKVHLLDGVTWQNAYTDPECAARFAEFFVDPDGPAMPEVQIEDRAIPGPHGQVDIRIYTPHGTYGRALVWLHGGGFGGGDLDMLEAHRVCAELAARADALVVSVGYRLAIDGVHYPVPVDDAHAAWLWLTSGAGSSSLLPTGPIALGGASAGAAIAMSTAIRLRGSAERRPDRLLLAYPFVHFPVPALDDETAAEMRELPALLQTTAAGVAGMVRNYVGRLTDLPPDAFPGAAPLADLPATAIALSEYDGLRPSGELLAVQLEESGVPVQTYFAAGMPHGHLNRAPGLAEVSRTLDFFASILAG